MIVTDDDKRFLKIMTYENLSALSLSLHSEDIFKQDCVLMEHRFDHRWDDVYCDYTTVQVFNQQNSNLHRL